MSYEVEQDHLLRLLREVEGEREHPIDEESDPEVDNVGKRTEKRIPSKKETLNLKQKKKTETGLDAICVGVFTEEDSSDNRMVSRGLTGFLDMRHMERKNLSLRWFVFGGDTAVVLDAAILNLDDATQTMTLERRWGCLRCCGVLGWLRCRLYLAYSKHSLAFGFSFKSNSMELLANAADDTELGLRQERTIFPRDQSTGVHLRCYSSAPNLTPISLLTILLEDLAGWTSGQRD
ncbi:hypothetical protein ILUMI_10338 [Ignelater luminosus]|uniref:Uncharacterized protein n=1 Tax=Ignelater luminosus TaxID=2038154 RepID=A0A8K0D436_IGNLU|nr:hypothetical protein ILUMI_10338 [Ignelater luminosus]